MKMARCRSHYVLFERRPGCVGDDSLQHIPLLGMLDKFCRILDFSVVSCASVAQWSKANLNLQTAACKELIRHACQKLDVLRKK